MSSDPYTYEGTDVLVNKFDIQDAQKLKEVEGVLWAAAAMKPIPDGSFDYNHLKKTHQHLFGATYEWAGQERSVDIIKGNSHFARKEFIENELNKVFSKLKAENHLKSLEPQKFCERLSFYFNEINAAHPFREGNGRTLRAFTDALAKNAGYTLDWSKVSEKEYIHANIAGFNADYGPMEHVFQKIASPSNQINIAADKITISPLLAKSINEYIVSKQAYDASAQQYFANITSPDKAKYKAVMDKASTELQANVEKLSKNPDYLDMIKHKKFEVHVSQNKYDLNTVIENVKKNTLTGGDIYKVMNLVDSYAKSSSISSQKNLSKGHCK